MLFLVIFLLSCLVISITINVVSVIRYSKNKATIKEHEEFYESVTKDTAKMIDTIKSYEDFYESTIADSVDMINYLEKLLNENIVLAEDTDVDRLRKCMKLFYDILVGYLNALPKNSEEERKEGEEAK